jgi:uncharacterized membrane protein YgcG
MARYTRVDDATKAILDAELTTLLTQSTGQQRRHIAGIRVVVRDLTQPEAIRTAAQNRADFLEKKLRLTTLKAGTRVRGRRIFATDRR